MLTTNEDKLGLRKIVPQDGHRLQPRARLVVAAMIFGYGVGDGLVVNALRKRMMRRASN